MTAYISISYSNRKNLQAEVDAIMEILQRYSITGFVFADAYSFNASQEKEMMAQAFTDIDRCVLLIAETSEKGIGIGVETGYAKAKGKPVIYLRNIAAAHSTTVSGASDFQIIYYEVADLQFQLDNVLKKINIPEH